MLAWLAAAAAVLGAVMLTVWYSLHKSIAEATTRGRQFGAVSDVSSPSSPVSNSMLQRPRTRFSSAISTARRSRNSCSTKITRTPDGGMRAQTSKSVMIACVIGLPLSRFYNSRTKNTIYHDYETISWGGRDAQRSSC